MKLRIAMVGACPYPVPQGSQVLLRDTALQAQSLGHEVHLVVYGYGLGEDTSGLPIRRCARLPFARKTAAGPSLAKPALDAALTLTLRRVVKAHAIDIVHAHNYEGLMVALCARKRPIVYHAHNAMADELPGYFGGAAWAAVLGRWMDHKFPRRADHVIAPHQRLADYLRSMGCEEHRVSVIPPAADLDAFRPCAVKDSLPAFLYTGNLDAYQNLPLLLDAVALARRSIPELRLIIATAAEGSIPGAEMQRTPDAEALKKVLGQDAVVACPRISWSGYPIKLVNAAAAGKAMVVCESAAHPLTHEQDGLVVPDDDAAAFAQALCRLATNHELRRTLGANARRTAETNHAPSVIAAQLAAVYEACRSK